jgi:hypothetical protein
MQKGEDISLEKEGLLGLADIVSLAYVTQSMHIVIM